MPAPLHADDGTYDATGWQSWPPVESGDWGLVYVTRGHLGGRFVYYDDDEGEDEAIVYMGGPLTSACYAVRLTLLRQPPFAGTLRSGLGAHDSEPSVPVPAFAPPPAVPLAAAPALAAPVEQPAAPVHGISGRLRSPPNVSLCNYVVPKPSHFYLSSPPHHDPIAESCRGSSCGDYDRL